MSDKSVTETAAEERMRYEKFGGVLIVCRGVETILPFGSLRHPGQIGALDRVAHAARAVVEMLPHGPDRYELEVALEAVNA